MHLFQDANRDFFVGSKPAAPIAVLVSLNQAVAGRRDAAFPFMRFMLDLGLDFQVILDDQVTPDHLKQFQCVVLPATDMLSEAQMSTLAAYRQNGRLVVFGPSGTRDEWDRDRPDGLSRLVGDLAEGAKGKAALVSADGRVAFIPLGVCGNFPRDMWYRRANDCNMAKLRKAFEGVLGKAWPSIAEPVQTREIHLARIDRPDGARLAAHVVNYDTARPSAPFTLALRLPDGLKPKTATLIVPEKPHEHAPVNIETVSSYNALYLRVRVPSVDVYGVVAIDLGT
jgi:hypothetical protein